MAKRLTDVLGVCQCGSQRCYCVYTVCDRTLVLSLEGGICRQDAPVGPEAE